ncbi:MAG: GMC family oxidoreductase N-terminal domain-containing protein [Flavobacteriales bacterium]|nr:GMC family oxidoreductase N-terminal domain-containing protein [Flavobacteriales bacterium]
MKPDHIVIGAGSSGAVVANRLSADGGAQVLLLEAGGKPHFLSHIPGWYSLLNRSRMDWAFWTEPLQHAGGRRVFIPRGRALGGCSATNAMAYVRGNAKDYDRWAEQGNSGWDFRSLLPYFKRSENSHVFRDAFHGNEGELHITRRARYSPPAYAFIEACREHGIPLNEDYNGERQEGVSFLQYTILDNKRQSTYDAFLKPIAARSNLRIRTGAFVKRILIEHDRAVGVEVFTGRDSTERILCNKEVILCAGAIQSPQLLKVSGIGDREELEPLGITTVRHLPAVGRNLQDHIWSGTSDHGTATGLNHAIGKPQFVKHLVRHLRGKESLLDNSIIETTAFFRSTEQEVVPDLQFHFTPLHTGGDYNADLYDPFTLPTTNGYTTLAILLHPESRGHIGLRSSDPRMAPIIQPNFLSHERDLQRLIIGLRKAMDVMDSGHFAPFRARPMNWPPRNASDDVLKEHIHRTLETLYHPVGTCRMGNGENSVVNAELQVHDLAGLRVADASIMPEIISGNTNAACIMIGEKVADMIMRKG